MSATPGHRYELHKTNTHGTDEKGKRYRWCIYDYFDISAGSGLSFWYFVSKKDAISKYPEAIAVYLNRCAIEAHTYFFCEVRDERR